MKKRALLQCTCHYMGQGVSALMMDALQFQDIEVHPNVSDIDCFAEAIKSNADINMAFITLPSNWRELSHTLQILYHHVRIDDSNISVIFIVDPKHRDLLSHYLAGRRGILAILDKDATITVFQDQLMEAMRSSVNWHQGVRLFPSLLTRRESMVLVHLLNEKSACNIADDLRISPKTVSCHKRAALKKLGFKSLQPLFM